MLKKLEYDALAADLAAVEALLADCSLEEDPIGYRQFTYRQQALQTQLNSLQAQTENYASLGLFFGGEPVQGSRGIDADFAGSALHQLQKMISTRYTGLESGPLSQRGKLPQSTHTNMVLTQLVRGSIGFVLEEANDNTEILATPLKTVVDEVCRILIAAGAPDPSEFELASDLLEQRMLQPLREFFILLDRYHAQIRVVCGTQDAQLDQANIQLARERVQALKIHENVQTFSGTLYYLPGKKTFELHTTGQGILDGKVLPEAAAQLAGQQTIDGNALEPQTISLRPLRVRIKVKEIHERNRIRRSHALHSVSGFADSIAH